MPCYFDKSKKRWRFTFNRILDGVRHRSTKLLPSAWGRTEAEAFDRKETGRLYAIASGLEKPDLSLAVAVQFYLDHHCGELKGAKNIARELSYLLPLIEDAPLFEAAEVATRYRLEHAAGLAPATIRNRLAYLKAAVRYAYRHHHYGDRDYGERIVLPRVANERQVYAKPAELEKLWDAFDDDEAQALFRLAYRLGVRWRTGLLERVPEDIRRNGRDVWLSIGITKNGTPRMKWVPPELRSELERIPFKRHWRHYYAAFERARNKAGLSYLRAHDLRHSLASAILSAGGTLPDVQAALDHESAQSAKRYAHMYPERVKAVLASVGKRSRKQAKKAA